MQPHDLAPIPLFHGLSARDLGSLAGVLGERDVAPGETLFEVGDKAWELFIVLSGGVEVELPPEAPDAAPRTLAKLGPGELLGEVCLIDGGRRSARCRGGSSGARLARLARPDFDRILNAGNPLAFRLIDLIAGQLVDRLRKTSALLQARVAG